MELTKERRGGAMTKQGLRELFRCVEILRGVRSEMPIQTASVLLAIAMRPGVLQRDLPAMLGLSQSSISRNVHALSRRDRHGKPGLGLVAQGIGPKGARSPELRLTKAGKELAKRLL